MRKLFEIYTDTKTLDDDAVERFIEDAKQETSVSFEEIARYIYQNNEGRNILVECEIPTGVVENGDMFLTAYEYEGEFEDYSADDEIACEEFNGDWNSLESVMRDMAESL